MKFRPKQTVKGSKGVTWPFFRIVRESPGPSLLLGIAVAQLALAATAELKLPFGMAGYAVADGCSRSEHYRPEIGDQLVLPAFLRRRLSERGELTIITAPTRADCGWPDFSLTKLVEKALRLSAAIAFDESRADAEMSSLVRIPAAVPVAENESVYVASVSRSLSYPLVLRVASDGRLVGVEPYDD